jgi:hypothetical protein
MATLRDNPSSEYREGVRGAYAKIIELIGCEPGEAGGVERIMRDRFRVLDGLARAEFKREAKMALKVLHELWKEAA